MLHVRRAPICHTLEIWQSLFAQAARVLLHDEGMGQADDGSQSGALMRKQRCDTAARPVASMSLSITVALFV
jgi:hypothetical protein